MVFSASRNDGRWHRVITYDVPPTTRLYDFLPNYFSFSRAVGAGHPGQPSALASSDRTRDEKRRDSSGNVMLTQTGNWSRRFLDLNGDGDAADGAGEMDDTGTFNKANEWLTRDLDSTPGTTANNLTLTYDAVGNLTDDGQDYTYVYDPFGRLRQVKNRATPFALVAEFTYNALGFRTGWHYDVDADGTVEAPGGTGDPWYYWCYDENWRIVATFRYNGSGTETESPKERFVFHAAGLDGQGSSSYIDSMVLRDRDNNGGGGWSGASDGTLESRIYYAQNWRADASAILSAAGVVQEWVKYSSYGVPTAIDPADFNRDGFVTGDDNTAFDDAYTNARPKADLDFDGFVTGDDNTLWSSYYTNGQNLGRGTLSRSDVNNRAGYAGYQFDPTFTGAQGSGGRFLYHVRHRVLDSGLGRWTRRDPLGRVTGVQLYAYVAGTPLDAVDPFGLESLLCLEVHWQVPYPPANSPGRDPAEICCATACATSPAILGITVCLRQASICCICADNIERNPVYGDPEFAEQLKTCVDQHESSHLPDVTCERARGCYPPSYPPSGVSQACSECDAYVREYMCVINITCRPQSPCAFARETRLAELELLMNRYCLECGQQEQPPRRRSAIVPFGPQRSGRR